MMSFSYHSDVSAGGTRRRVRKKRIRDADGKVIGHGAVEMYHSGSNNFSMSHSNVVGSYIL